MYRRVVPSPDPISIVESTEIEALLDRGVLVITVGGGGIPVVGEEDTLRGVEAVIDKDRASAVLGAEIDADVMLVLTDVDHAYLDFASPDQQPIGQVSPSQMREYVSRGEFAEGSMLPKVKAAIDFVEAGGNRAIITSVDHIDEALAGESGTEIRHA